MPAEDRPHLERLLDIRTRYLHELEEKIALQGLSASAGLQLEVEDVRAQITELRRRLAEPGMAPDAGAAVRQNLPPRSEFVGREQELTTLRDALLTRSQVITLIGMGGAGKTAIALEVAHAALGAGFESVVWLPTGGRSLEPRELIDATARVLGHESVLRLPDEDKIAQLDQLLRGRRCLLVLDGFESVLDPAVERWLRSLPEPNKALVTSRRTLPDTRTVTLRGLPLAEALLLLRHEGQRLGVPDLAEVPDAELAPLCTATGGSPQVIKWAVALIRDGWAIADVMDELQSAHADLFEMIMGTTWQSLTLQARKLVTAMSLLAAPAPRRLLQRAAELSDRQFPDAVQRLAEGSLLEVQGPLNQRVYGIPPLLAAYARRQLGRSESGSRAALSRLAGACLALVTANNDAYAPDFDAIDAQVPNLLHVLNQCWERGEHRALVDLVDALAEFFWVRGYWSERARRAGQAYEAALALGDSFAAGRAAYFAGWVYSRWLRREDALLWTDRAAQQFRVHYGDDSPYEAQLRGLIAFRARSGAGQTCGAGPEDAARLREAERLLLRALNLFRQDRLTPNPGPYVTTVKDNLGELYRDWRRPDEAARWFREVLADAEEHSWEERLATSAGDLGDLALAAGDLPAAQALYEQGLRHAVAVGRLNTIALCNEGLGSALAGQDRADEAYEHLTRAADIYQRLGYQDAQERVEQALTALAGTIVRTLAPIPTREDRSDGG